MFGEDIDIDAAHRRKIEAVPALVRLSPGRDSFQVSLSSIACR